MDLEYATECCAMEVHASDKATPRKPPQVSKRTGIPFSCVESSRARCNLLLGPDNGKRENRQCADYAPRKPRASTQFGSFIVRTAVHFDRHVAARGLRKRSDTENGNRSHPYLTLDCSLFLRLGTATSRS